MSTSRIATVVSDRRGDDWSAGESSVPLDAADPAALHYARELLQRSVDVRRRALAQLSDLELLRRLGVVTAAGTFTRGGALMLTANTSGAQVSYVHRRTPAGQLTVNDRLGGPLLLGTRRVLELVSARVERTSVNLPGGQQLQIADLPDAAVREAVINGVMHRDHGRSGIVQIEHTSTRLVVTSPGPFVSGVTEQNVLTTSSRTRNTNLASLVRTLDLAETAGSGVDRMYAEMARLGHQPPSFEADLETVRVTLLGGAPNAYLARFTASLPAAEADDADTMLVLLTLLTRRTVTADVMAPLMQKSPDESAAVLDRLSAPPVEIIERTRESARRALPVHRLREHVVTALGPALSYGHRTVDESDRKIVAMVHETGEINGRMVRILLDLDTPTASRTLSDLVKRGVLVKTSTAQRGPAVTYGRGPNFPSVTRTRRAPRA